MRSLVFEGSTWEAYEKMREKDKKLHKALCKLLKEMLRSDDPSTGIGKPESLKHNLSGLWSRRISGDCQPSCPSIKVHAAHLLSSISLARPGFRETSITGLQSRVAPVQRLGFFALAALKTASR